MVWLWQPCECDTFLNGDATSLGPGQCGERERQPGSCVSLTGCGLTPLGSPQLTTNMQLWHRLLCPLYSVPTPHPPPEKGWAAFEACCGKWWWEGQSGRSLKLQLCQARGSPQQFCPRSLWLSSGFSAVCWNIGAAGSLLQLPYQPWDSVIVKFYCLSLSMTCKCLCEGWWWREEMGATVLKAK